MNHLPGFRRAGAAVLTLTVPFTAAVSSVIAAPAASALSASSASVAAGMRSSGDIWVTFPLDTPARVPGTYDPSGTSTARPDVVATGVGRPIDFDVLANDTLAPGLQYVIGIEVTTHGYLTMTPHARQGQFRYIPDAGFVGTDRFRYLVMARNPGVTRDTEVAARGAVTLLVTRSLPGGTSDPSATGAPAPGSTATPDSTATSLAPLPSLRRTPGAPTWVGAVITGVSTSVVAGLGLLGWYLVTARRRRTTSAPPASAPIPAWGPPPTGPQPPAPAWAPPPTTTPPIPTWTPPPTGPQPPAATGPYPGPEPYPEPQPPTES